MTKDEIIAAIRDIKSATHYVDEVVDQVIAALGGQPAPETAQEPELKLENVRAILADMSRKGYTAQIRELLGKYGAAKLPEVDPANYNALLEDVEGLDHA